MIVTDALLWGKDLVTSKIITFREYNKIMEKTIWERKGKLAELDRSFDLKFWQAQPATERFQAAWELMQHAWRVKGHDVCQLRLQRSVESFQCQQEVKR